MKCKQQVASRTKKGATKRCGNNAIEGCDFCKVHMKKEDVDKENKKSEEMEHSPTDSVTLPLPVPIPEKNVDYENEQYVIKGMNAEDITLMLNSILTSLNELKISVEKKTKLPKQTPIFKKAKCLFYHDMKKDIKFKEYVATLHNLNIARIPWQLLKEKSDIYWDTCEQSIKDKYIAIASSST